MRVDSQEHRWYVYIGKVAHKYCKSPRIASFGQAPCKKCVERWRAVFNFVRPFTRR